MKLGFVSAILDGWSFEEMIDTARVIKADSAADQVGLFDTVDVYFEDHDEALVFGRQTVRLYIVEGGDGP